jgi:hypothetical protein
LEYETPRAIAERSRFLPSDHHHADGGGKRQTATHATRTKFRQPDPERPQDGRGGLDRTTVSESTESRRHREMSQSGAERSTVGRFALAYSLETERNLNYANL